MQHAIGVGVSSMPRPSLYALEEALELPRSPYAGSSRSAPSGGFEPYIRHSTKVEGGSSDEVYPALLGNRLKTLTGTLTGTGYRRNTPHPAKTPLESGFLHRIPPHHAQKTGSPTEKVAGSSTAERPLIPLQMGDYSCLSSVF